MDTLKTRVRHPELRDRMMNLPSQAIKNSEEQTSRVSCFPEHTNKEGEAFALALQSTMPEAHNNQNQ